MDGTVFQIGQPPARVDILQHIDGLTFDQAWENRLEGLLDGEIRGVLRVSTYSRVGPEGLATRNRYRYQSEHRVGEDRYSVLRACEGLVEDARRAGMSPAAAAAAVRVRLAIARTVRFMPLVS
jgi:hypothetical protein